MPMMGKGTAVWRNHYKNGWSVKHSLTNVSPQHLMVVPLGLVRYGTRYGPEVGSLDWCSRSVRYCTVMRLKDAPVYQQQPGVDSIELCLAP